MFVFLWDLWLPYFFIHLAYLSTASWYMSSPLTLCTVRLFRMDRHSKISTDHILTWWMFQKNWELSADGRFVVTAHSYNQADYNFVIVLVMLCSNNNRIILFCVLTSNFYRLMVNKDYGMVLLKLGIRIFCLVGWILKWWTSKHLRIMNRSKR